MARTRLLTHDAIARAAFEVADTGGAGALTMGNLARALGVAQMTLYNYAASKQEIINMLPDVLLADLVPLKQGDGWRQTIEQCFLEVYDRMTRHPGVTQLIAANPVSSRAQTQLSDAVRAVLEDAGYAPGDALSIHRTVSTYTLGFALFALAEQQSPTPQERADARQFRIGLEAVIGAF